MSIFGTVGGSGTSSSSMFGGAGSMSTTGFDPWGETGGRLDAAKKLKELMNGNFTTSDPSYNWRFNQGQQALERSLAAKGLLNSGRAATELVDYGQNQGAGEYQAQFGRLRDLAGVGLDPTAAMRLKLTQQSQSSSNPSGTPYAAGASWVGGQDFGKSSQNFIDAEYLRQAREADRQKELEAQLFGTKYDPSLGTGYSNYSTPSFGGSSGGGTTEWVRNGNSYSAAPSQTLSSLIQQPSSQTNWWDSPVGSGYTW